MEIVKRGVLARGEAGTARAALTFPSVVALADGTLLAACHAGSTKDAADEQVEFFRSGDGGRTWGEGQRPFGETQVDGVGGSIKACYVTELEAGRLIIACLWVDRQTYPDKPLFNGETEGCLPMAILLADSHDGGATWTPLRKVPMPDDIGPPSLTSPILQLADGTLVMSIETNKHYLDSSKWYQRVVFFHSADGGQTWGEPVTVGQDESGRIFYWDLRVGVAHDGRVGAFSWTYDSEANKYLSIHRRVSADGGQTWSAFEALDFADQAAHPAMLADGRVVLAWVDRFGSHSIRARLAAAVDAPFDDDTEVEIYAHEVAASDTDNTGALLEDMGLWSFGLPYGEVLPDGDVMVVYYAGTEEAMDIHWARLRLDA
tara:strand:+ start:28 stop:1149 length:1122 start_codon:yes stop_codon:yes gene_type:complete